MTPAKLRTDSFLTQECRYFLAVAETGTVRQAAARLNVAASAISRKLAKLEAGIGAVLFERKGRSLSLSPAGQLLAQGLRRASLSHDEILEQLDSLAGLRRGTIRLATVESISVDVLPRLLQNFAKAHPGITFRVEVAGSDAVTERVREQSADLGLTFNPKNVSGLDVVLERKFQLCAVMARRHPLAKAKSVTLAQCFAHPVAWPAEGLSLRSLLDAAARGQHHSPAYECNSLRLMASLAAQGHCIAFQTEIGIERELKDRVLAAIPLADKALGKDALMIVARAGQAKRPAIEAFLKFCREALA